jgi:hypothetical protein
VFIPISVGRQAGARKANFGENILARVKLFGYLSHRLALLTCHAAEAQ